MTHDQTLPNSGQPMRVLFLCTHNSSRSQMAEGFLRARGGQAFQVFSAGTLPRTVHPLAIQAMAELDIDLSGHWSKGIEDFENQLPMDLVVTVCDEAAEACPFFPHARRQEHWGFPDPSAATGSELERLAVFRQVRDAISARLNRFLEQERRENTRVRLARETDAAAIAAIYNQGIEDRVGTFETEVRTEAMVQSWFDGVHPIVVVEEQGEVIAYASTSTYRTRACYAGIAEFSVYVRRDWRGKGAGRVAMTRLLEECEKAGFWKLVSRAFVENAASRGLLRSLGFREVGVYEKHGQLDGVWRDVVIVEYLLTSNLVTTRRAVE